jgi:hypothetical protein
MFGKNNRNNNNVDTKILAYLWGAFPLRVALGFMATALLATTWAVSTINERTANVERATKELSLGQNTKEKNANIYRLMEEARRLTVSGNSTKNADQIRDIYGQVLNADPNNASAYIELAKLELKVSKATAYKDKTEASRLKEQAIRDLALAKSIYEKTNQEEKAEQTRKVMDDINKGIATYNLCFPTTAISSVPGSNCSKL